MKKVTRIQEALIAVKPLRWLHQWLMNQAAENMQSNILVSAAYERAAMALEVILETHTREIK